jgi:hypothetical protein
VPSSGTLGDSQSDTGCIAGDAGAEITAPIPLDFGYSALLLPHVRHVQGKHGHVESSALKAAQAVLASATFSPQTIVV